MSILSLMLLKKEPVNLEGTVSTEDVALAKVVKNWLLCEYARAFCQHRREKQQPMGRK